MEKKPQARVRLLCFPHAGGSVSLFYRWGEYLGEHVQVCPIELPGHWHRMYEGAPHTRLADLVQEAGQALTPLFDMPVAFFGYSLGALLSFELARWFRAEHALLPTHLFVGACGAPQTRSASSAAHKLPDAEFIKHIAASYDNIPDAVLREPELLQALVRVMRADIQMLETYVYRPQPALGCTITTFAGDADNRVTLASMPQWAQQSTQPIAAHIYSGGHFFIKKHLHDMMRIVALTLRTTTA